MRRSDTCAHGHLTRQCLTCDPDRVARLTAELDTMHGFAHLLHEAGFEQAKDTNEARAEVARLTAERDDAHEEVALLCGEKAELLARVATLEQERDRLVAEWAALKATAVYTEWEGGQ